MKIKTSQHTLIRTGLALFFFQLFMRFLETACTYVIMAAVLANRHDAWRHVQAGLHWRHLSRHIGGPSWGSVARITPCASYLYTLSAHNPVLFCAWYQVCPPPVLNALSIRSSQLSALWNQQKSNARSRPPCCVYRGKEFGDGTRLYKVVAACPIPFATSLAFCSGPYSLQDVAASPSISEASLAPTKYKIPESTPIPCVSTLGLIDVRSSAVVSPSSPHRHWLPAAAIFCNPRLYFVLRHGAKSWRLSVPRACLLLLLRRFSFSHFFFRFD